VFTTLHEPGRDPTNLEQLRDDIAPHRQQIHDLLAKGTRGRDPKTRRFRQGLLDHETALWTFTRVPGVPATNNASERALRHAVILVQHCFSSRRSLSNSPAWWAFTWIRRPLRFPRWTYTAASSPRWTLCNTV
jgi:hypothetical protein